jgi:hypothetical protein
MNQSLSTFMTMVSWLKAGALMTKMIGRQQRFFVTVETEMLAVVQEWNTMEMDS